MGFRGTTIEIVVAEVENLPIVRGLAAAEHNVHRAAKSFVEDLARHHGLPADPIVGRIFP